MTARGRTRDEGSIERGESPKRVDRERRWEGGCWYGKCKPEREKGKRQEGRFKGPIPRERSEAAKNNSLRETLCVYQRRAQPCVFQWLTEDI